jgi:hypothetical protein
VLEGGVGQGSKIIHKSFCLYFFPCVAFVFLLLKALRITVLLVGFAVGNDSLLGFAVGNDPLLGFAVWIVFANTLCLCFCPWTTATHCDGGLAPLAASCLLDLSVQAPLVEQRKAGFVAIAFCSDLGRLNRTMAQMPAELDMKYSKKEQQFMALWNISPASSLASPAKGEADSESPIANDLECIPSKSKELFLSPSSSSEDAVQLSSPLSSSSSSPSSKSVTSFSSPPRPTGSWDLSFLTLSNVGVVSVVRALALHQNVRVESRRNDFQRSGRPSKSPHKRKETT